MDYKRSNHTTADGVVVLSEVTDLDELVEYSAKLLLDDGVILTPTDTVYGLICMPTSETAVRRVFEMKDRPVQKHLPIIASDWRQVKEELPVIWSDEAKKLADSFWPGALTIALGIAANDIAWLSGRVEAGIRVPDHLYIQKLARRLGPLLMTSANRSGVATPHTLPGALASLVAPPALAIDGGELSGAPSTLVNLNLPEPRVERVGSIPKSEIEKVLYHE